VHADAPTDPKPGNVMIDGRGHARVADFGLAAAFSRILAVFLAGSPS